MSGPVAALLVIALYAVIAAFVMRVRAYEAWAAEQGKVQRSPVDWWKVPEARERLRQKKANKQWPYQDESNAWTEEERLRRAFARGDADTVEFILALEEWVGRELSERDADVWEPLVALPRKRDARPARPSSTLIGPPARSKPSPEPARSLFEEWLLQWAKEWGADDVKVHTQRGGQIVVVRWAKARRPPVAIRMAHHPHDGRGLRDQLDTAMTELLGDDAYRLPGVSGFAAKHLAYAPMATTAELR